MAALKDSNLPVGETTSGADASWLPVREGEDAWTAEEFAEVRRVLQDDVARIAEEVEMSEADLIALMRDDGGGSGDDSADTGGKVLEREQELTLTHNSRLLLEQSRRALRRLADHSYGLCEQCALPIGKMRLQAFPRATLCVACKQKSERR